MPTPDARTAVLEDLEWRRMIADHTDLDALRASMAGGPLSYYGGFDPPHRASISAISCCS